MSEVESEPVVEEQSVPEPAPEPAPEPESELAPELESLNGEGIEVDGPPADEREPVARTLKRLGVNSLGFPIGS